MGLLVPVALGLLALAIPIIIFYMLKLRRRDRVVSSSLLWRRVLLDRAANAPWQRLRRNLLLLLQLLLLILLVVSLARPFLYTDAPISGNAVVVLDASASMLARDTPGGASRWERALSEAERLIDGLGSNDRMALIWAGPGPSMSAAPTSDKAALRAALRTLQPSSGRGGMDGALTLAAGTARQLGGATVALISDGAFPDADLPVMPGPTLFLPMGGAGRNLGITALSVRDAAGGPELFASVYNSGEVTATALLSVEADGALRDSRRVSVGPGADAGVTLGGLPLDTAIVEARLVADEQGSDALAADDTAWAVRGAAGAEGSVLLVTAGNSFLEKALNLLPGARVSKTSPEGYAPSGEYALTIFDGFVPAELSPGNLLLFAPTDSPLVPVSGTIAAPQVGQVEVTDPLLRFVELSDLHIGSAARMATPTWARVLVRSEAGEPLIMAGETAGRRVVVFAFDLHRSDLPLRVAFPILLANIAEWLRPGGRVSASATLSAGEAITVRLLPEADTLVVTPPRGAETSTMDDLSGGEAQFAETGRLGVYEVRQFAGDRALGEPERFAVNLFSREESNIAARAGVGLVGSVGSAPAVGGQRAVELWPWLLLASLLLMALEWWVYNRAGRPLFPARQKSPEAEGTWTRRP